MLFRSNVDEHERLRVAAERVLQQVGELGVAVRHVLLAGGERGDDGAERRERLVDRHRLLLRLPRGLRLAEALRAREVDERELADVLVARLVVLRAHGERDDHVRARRLVVEAGRRGDVAELSLMLLRGEDINSMDQTHCTAFHQAAANGHFEAMELLIEKGADIELRG